ncbi:MAG: hypothetical protein ACTTJH_00595 [Bacteroidales bacterium]
MGKLPLPYIENLSPFSIIKGAYTTTTETLCPVRWYEHLFV